MLAFESDYTTGAHPEILKRLVETNGESLVGYGEDEYCARAKKKILDACNAPEGQVFFLVGGTQTNRLVISTVLRPFEGVMAAQTGHIAVHEAGAIEGSGHKVITLPQREGKVDARDVDAAMAAWSADGTKEHMVCPAMVYISHPTEYGTLYSRKELTALSETCHKWGLSLYLDGARLAYGLQSPETDVDLPTVAALCDAFYIGGTKVGCLCGEAVVFPKGNAPRGFFTMVKQQGALMAKGRVLGVQFDTLFTNDLYFRIGERAVSLAMKIRDCLKEKGYDFAIESPTNQQFPILTAEKMEQLRPHVRFSVWEPTPDGRTVVRFATGPLTTEEEVEALCKLL